VYIYIYVLYIPATSGTYLQINVYVCVYKCCTGKVTNVRAGVIRNAQARPDGRPAPAVFFISSLILQFFFFSILFVLRFSIIIFYFIFIF